MFRPRKVSATWATFWSLDVDKVWQTLKRLAKDCPLRFIFFSPMVIFRQQACRYQIDVRHHFPFPSPTHRRYLIHSQLQKWPPTFLRKHVLVFLVARFRDDLGLIATSFFFFSLSVHFHSLQSISGCIGHDAWRPVSHSTSSHHSFAFFLFFDSLGFIRDICIPYILRYSLPPLPPPQLSGHWALLLHLAPTYVNTTNRLSPWRCLLSSFTKHPSIFNICQWPGTSRDSIRPHSMGRSDQQHTLSRCPPWRISKSS